MLLSPFDRETPASCHPVDPDLCCDVRGGACGVFLLTYIITALFLIKSISIITVNQPGYRGDEWQPLSASYVHRTLNATGAMFMYVNVSELLSDRLPSHTEENRCNVDSCAFNLKQWL